MCRLAGAFRYRTTAFLPKREVIIRVAGDSDLGRGTTASKVTLSSSLLDGHGFHQRNDLSAGRHSVVTHMDVAARTPIQLQVPAASTDTLVLMGESACFMASTCLVCGRVLTRPVPEGSACPHCGRDPFGDTVTPLESVQRVNTILYCRRWHETVDFYRDVIGLPVTFTNDWFVEFRIAAGAAVSIADAARSTVDAVQGKGITISIEVNDLDAVRQHLIRAGGNPDEVTKRFGSTVFDVFDPEGHRIEFWAG